MDKLGSIFNEATNLIDERYLSSQYIFMERLQYVGEFARCSNLRHYTSIGITCSD